ncbi:MAG TPA: hypothetical protein VH170_07460 [Chthoniobacterales bacterium]|jgi:hypothetical protein|nr:hypothetical protein [Chthoniobacterales bacterium]
MASLDASDFRLCVLNPGGRDLEQYFDEPAGPDAPVHPPINLHAFAACTGGSFHRATKNALEEKRPILLVLRGNFRATERALSEIKNADRLVAVTLKETGLHQIAGQLCDPKKLARFMRVVAEADGCIATTPEAAGIFRRVRADRDPSSVGFVPTPYPLEDRQWDFAVPPGEQRGIFVGTREWNVPSRNHFAALLLAREICVASGEPVTVFNLDGRKGEKLLAELKFPAGKLRVHEKREPYADYLRELARHKIVLQLDRSRVPGQVAGDALLARTICVGGDGTIDRLAFGNYSGEGRTSAQIKTIALELIKNTAERAKAIVETQWRAAERMSFSAVRKQLAYFFNRLADGPTETQPNLPAIPK